MARQLAALLLLAGAHAAAAANCADTLPAARSLLGDLRFPLDWEETTMADGRPLLVSLDERDGALFIAFHKAGAGLWAQGPARLCQRAGSYEVRFAPDGLVTGPSINWLARRGLQRGAAIGFLRLAAGELQLEAMGWSGRFTAVAPGFVRWKP